VMIISKSFSSFFKFFLPFSLATVLRKHMILNQIFNQKQVKMKRWEDPSNHKHTHGPNFFFKNHSLATWSFYFQNYLLPLSHGLMVGVDIGHIFWHIFNKK
jgi:hypothetical protein